MTYPEYLLSNHWKKLRRIKLEEAGYKCERCESTWYLQVHHKLYRKSWFDSIPEDLEVVCSYCHKKAHGILGVNERPIYTFKERQTIVSKLCPNNVPVVRPKKQKPEQPFNPKKRVARIMSDFVIRLKQKRPIAHEIDRAIESLEKLRQDYLDEVRKPPQPL